MILSVSLAVVGYIATAIAYAVFMAKYEYRVRMEDYGNADKDDCALVGAVQGFFWPGAMLLFGIYLLTKIPQGSKKLVHHLAFGSEKK